MEFLLVLAGGAVSLVSQWALSEWQKKQKAAELYELRVDRYRDDLSRVLAEFFEAVTRYSESVLTYVEADVLLTLSMDGGERQQRHHQRWVEADQQMIDALVIARVKGFRLLTLVKKDHHLVAEVNALVMEPQPNPGADREEARLAAEQRRARLRALTERLSGVFVLDPPPVSEGFDPSEIQTTDRKLLP